MPMPPTHNRRSTKPTEPIPWDEGPERDKIRKGICGARAAKGGLCHRSPGQGTDHPGVGRCNFHGGNSQTGKVAAGVVIGQGMMLDGKQIMGTAIEIAPAEALAQCVYIAAGEVAYCTMRIAQLDEEDVVVR